MTIEPVDEKVGMMSEEYKPDSTCFVICPIGDEGTATRKRSDQMLKHIIEPVCAENGLLALRSDRIEETRLITNQIVHHIAKDRLVVADLTERNPNVFYELALRHAMQKPYVQLLMHGETLPFDVTNVNTVFYILSDPDGLAECRNRFAGYVAAAIEPDAPVESPFSAAMSLIQLLDSGDQGKIDYAEVRSELAELRVEVGQIGRMLNHRLHIPSDVQLSPAERAAALEFITHRRALELFSDQLPQDPQTPHLTDAEVYKVGMPVVHPKFGKGVLVSAGPEPDPELVLAFHQHGVKRMPASFLHKSEADPRPE